MILRLPFTIELLWNFRTVIDRVYYARTGLAFYGVSVGCVFFGISYSYLEVGIEKEDE